MLHIYPTQEDQHASTRPRQSLLPSPPRPATSLFSIFCLQPIYFHRSGGYPSTSTQSIHRFTRKTRFFFRSSSCPYRYPNAPPSAPTSKLPVSAADHPPCAASSSAISTPA